MVTSTLIYSTSNLLDSTSQKGLNGPYNTTYYIAITCSNIEEAAVALSLLGIANCKFKSII